MKIFITVVVAVFLMAPNNFAADTSEQVKTKVIPSEVLNYFSEHWLKSAYVWEYTKGALVSEKIYPTKEEAKKDYEFFKDLIRAKGIEPSAISGDNFVASSSNQGCFRIRPLLDEKCLGKMKKYNDRIVQKKLNAANNPDLDAKLTEFAEVMQKLAEEENQVDVDLARFLRKKFSKCRLPKGVYQTFPTLGNEKFVLFIKPFVRFDNDPIQEVVFSLEQIDFILALVKEKNQ